MPQMVNLGTPTSPTIYTKKYGKFRGVDFSQSETMVDDSRSPHAVNLIADLNGFPEKRLGWRTIKKLPARINGIFHYRGTIKQGEGEAETEEIVDCFIVHAGDKIYRWNGAEETTELLSGINDEISTGRLFNERLFILTGAELLEFNGKACVRVEDGEGTYVPTTLRNRGTAFYTSEGTGDWYESARLGSAYQDINIACAKRKNTFRIAKDYKNYQRYIFLDGKIKPSSRIVMTYIPTKQVIFDITAPADDTLTSYIVEKGLFTYPGGGVGFDTKINVCLDWAKAGTEISKTAKGVEVSEGAVIGGYMTPSGVEDFVEPAENEDNFCIEYVAESGKQGGAVSKCTIMEIFENRIFYSGNPDFPNTDWHSELNEPTYVTDLSYTDVGLDSAPIIGYLRTGSEQAILKADSEDATVYMRYRAEDSEGNAIFPIRQGSSGVGAVSRRAVCTVLDDPMYLSRNGVYAIAQQDISSERALNLRSTRVNNKLRDELNLASAHMTSWKGNMLLFANGNCYVADTAQKSYAGNKTGTFEYEWYYWTNIPAKVATEHQTVLYFGTEDGRICRFNDDMTTERGEFEPSAYSDDGEAIVAEWATNLSDDGDFMRLKTMKKKGSGIMLKTYLRSGVKVCIRTDKEFEREILSKSAGIFNFEDIDFNDFTFNTSEYSVIPFNAKFKKYKAIQVICRNDKVNQAFGILGIIRRYVIGNFAK